MEFTISSDGLFLQQVKVSEGGKLTITSFISRSSERIYPVRTSIQNLLDEIALFMASNPTDKNLFIRSEIHPTFLGQALISYMRVFHKYLGGAHGVSGYHLYTHSFRSKKHLKVRDLFSNWTQVKEQVIEVFLQRWEETKEDFIDREFGDGEDALMFSQMIQDVGRRYRELVRKKLGEKSFIITFSKVGLRLNIYFPPYSLGPFVCGGSWISLPLKNLSKKLINHLAYPIFKNVIEGLPRGLDYLGYKTKHILSWSSPKDFDREFFIGSYDLDVKSGLEQAIAEKLIKLGNRREVH